MAAHKEEHQGSGKTHHQKMTASSNGAPGHQDEVREYLKDLPPGCSEYDVTGLAVEDIEELVQQHFGQGEYIIFKNISPHTFDELSARKEHLGRKKDYYQKLSLLLIRIAGPEHEETVIQFHNLLTTKLNDMIPKLAQKLRHRLATRVEGTDRLKEPDSSYTPRTLPPGRTVKWPTLVLEVGRSESSIKLEQDARWWLDESGGKVKLVLTIKVYHSHRVEFNIWRMGGSSAFPRPAMAQSTTVSRSWGGKLSASGRLVIPFEDLFLRPAQNAGEEDILLGKEDLEEMVELADCF